MNSITETVEYKEIKIPMNKRVWLWLKDHLGKTSSEICAGLNTSASFIGPAISDLQRRGMVKWVHQRLTHRDNRLCRVYYVIGSSNKFELQPRIKPSLTDRSKAKKTVVRRSASKQLELKLDAPPVKIDINSLSVAEARELYDQLKKIFG